MFSKFIFTVSAVLLSLGAFAISPVTGSVGVCIGSSTTLTDATTGGTWTSSNPAKASVVAASGLVTGVSAGTVTITYTVGLSYVTYPFTVSAPPAAITGTGSVCYSQTTTLTDATSGGVWSSSNTAIATVSAGVVTGMGITGGTANISYTISGCGVAKAVSVNAAAAIGGTGIGCIGSPYTIIPSFPGGSWTSGTPTLATVSSAGLVTPVAPGVVNIYYTAGGCYSFQSVTVNTAPASISGGTEFCAGSTLAFTDATTGGTWSSSNTRVATVNAAGLVTTVAAGADTISYNAGGVCSATKIITVDPVPVALTGSSGVCTGSSITLTETITGGTWTSSNTAMATVSSAGVVSGITSGVVNISYTIGLCYAVKSVTVNATPAAIAGSSNVCTGSSILLTDVTAGGTWSSSNTSIAAISTGGNVNGVTAGIVTIDYTIGTCFKSTSVTVNPTPSAISGDSTVCVGASLTLADATGGGTWTSSSTATATVSSAGVVRGVAGGTVTITYTLGTCYVTKTIHISPIPVALTGSSSICLGMTTALTDAVTGGAWWSDNTTIATVGSTGIVTGTGGGSVNINYGATGCSVSKTITVNAVAAITGSSSVCIGAMTTLGVATTGGSWTSGSPSLATVSSAGVVTGVTGGVVNIYYTIGGCYSFQSVTVNTTSAISGSSSVCAGSSITLSATPSGGTWNSSAALTASVGSTGNVAGIAAGTANISYTISGCGTISKPITVNLTPLTITGSSSLCSGSATLLTDVTSGGIWTSDNAAVAGVGSATGILTGFSGGSTNISYTLGSCGVYKTVTVNGPAAIIGSSSLCAGTTITLTNSIAGGVWASSTPSVATISPAGVVTGIAPGVTTISYTIGSCFASYTVTVNAAAAIIGSTAICIGSPVTLSGSPSGGIWSVDDPSVATVTSGGMVTGITPGIVTVYYATGSCGGTSVSVTVSPVPSAITGGTSLCLGSSLILSDATTGGTWASSNTAIATVDASGDIFGLSGGVVTISYSTGSCFATHAVTINAVAAITGSTSLCIGSTITLSASTSGGSWTSGSPTLAPVSSAGVVTGLGAGVVNIYYTIGGCYSFQPVTVNASPATISGSSSVCVGSSVLYTASMPGGTWSSSNTSVAPVTSSGSVSGLSAGVTNISYTLGGCFVYQPVTVNAAPLPISGITGVCVGASIPLTDLTPGGTWTSSSEPVATVTSIGTVTGVSAGSVLITYTIGTCSVSNAIAVNPSPSPISGSTSLCNGVAVLFTDATSGGRWSSSNVSIAPVTSTGFVDGITTGTANISYTVAGCAAYETVTVNLSPTPIIGGSTVCAGASTLLTDLTLGGTWSSSSASIATVTSAGSVTGISAGSVLISYTIGSCSVSNAIAVNPSPMPVSGSTSLCIGTPVLFTDATSGGTWSSSNTSVAPVTSAGIVNGIATGSANISYSIGGCYAYEAITVNRTPSSVSGTGSVCSGAAISLTDPSFGGSWSSGSTAIATVTSSGSVTGVTAGMVNISYSFGTCSVYKTITVNITPAAITGSSSVGIGRTTTLSDATPGGVWSTGSTTIASVSPTTGVVTGVFFGTTAIRYTIGSCGVSKNITVTFVPSVESGTVTGTIVTATSTGGVVAGTPVKGTVVNIVSAGSQQMIATTVTDDAGRYSFNSLQEGRYMIQIAEPGYTAATTVYANISGTSIDIDGIDFTKQNSERQSGVATIIENNGTIKLFPNPATSNLNILWEDQATGNATIVITDMAGREVLTATMEINTAAGKKQVDLSNLNNGMYVISVKGNSIDYSGKLMIQQH